VECNREFIKDLQSEAHPMTVDDRTQPITCRICGGGGETRVICDDVEFYLPCECRGGPPADTPSAPVSDPARMREIFDALAAGPGDGRLYQLRMLVARAMATAAFYPYLIGMPRLVDAGMILDDKHRADLLSNFRDPRLDLTARADRLGQSARALAELCEVVRHAPLRVRLSDA
jgi:hypothetical protein